ncbi:MAG: hypothetical protein ACIAS6_03845 [Phycisphaerales bacterium JB060]
MQTRPRLAHLAALALAATASTLLLGGCYSSSDSYPYVSKTWTPKTFVLVDSRTGDELWRYDLAVGNKMKIRFFEGDTDDRVMPDEMRWEVVSIETGDLLEKDEMPCPPQGVRRIDWYLRDAPEYPRPNAPRGEPGPIPQTTQDDPTQDEPG